jgi:hypothetical protein
MVAHVPSAASTAGRLLGALILELSAVAARDLGTESIVVRFPTGAMSVGRAVKHLIGGLAVADEFTVVDAP